MEDDSGENDLRENRFAYLLQPIRDLAANWDVNIAAELEEYLEELENLTFTIEGHGPSLNFAEAALLIQVGNDADIGSLCLQSSMQYCLTAGLRAPPSSTEDMTTYTRTHNAKCASRTWKLIMTNVKCILQGTTCVFSKKVEHLYNLVYQALDTIFNKRQKEKAAAARKDKAGGKGAESEDLDEAETFLALDGLLEEGQDIDLDEEDGAGVHAGDSRCPAKACA
jgi:hypothetical protein